ncbi:MAG: sigma-E factor negative regulatory protein [Gammaproteobacteria bacterium]|uniref:sigma-E factor negative regulatory protein n=1 Tax=Rhodoferax sp. TaxID=50421 RepID=UPI00182D2CD0|nr:sigma-E factor negative regulatory protein [Rhodoferax sp.]MBU3898185.1 sigma-E factor negative regulatory protein [Gammaproteobacteria bacterium]MBA3057891.1 anti-sigma factor [Rhodoferax sp.]MBU3998544.1 sigma-E factor negative regulatory protein [Gammaproteobacteria bacterium]MBU4019000.1 sigma-E factor negative regulatory protein [Gammaproteobacteria bacterium]MBU4081620.1 sigma-E factor negative regulatory protein [Gammaproteobacteria bacterium]
MQEAARNHELVSALADGQLRGEEFARTVDWVNETDEARRTWHTYHLVGDVLRSNEPMVSARDVHFLQGLKLRLQQESAPLHDVRTTVLVADEQDSTWIRRPNDAKYSSANDSRFGWKMLAGFASLATMAVMVWQMASGGGDQSAAPQLAQLPVQVPQPVAGSAPGGTGVDRQRMIRDPQLDALLAAHKQFGGTSALQGPTGFLRNATFDGVAP